MGTVHGQLPEWLKRQGPIDMKKSTIMPESIPDKGRSGSRNKEWEPYGNM